MQTAFTDDQIQFREVVARFLQDKSQTTATRKLIETDEGYDPAENCYEYIEFTLENTRNRLRFWVEGVVVFVMGSFGLVGNLVTILVLRRYRKNRSFNVLIIW